MKRPLKKLIAFSTATAALLNMSAISSAAEYVAEQVGESEYSFLMQTGNGYIYSENGTADDLTEGSKLIVIGNDGSKSEITLAEGISGIYNYTSTTMGEYNYICPTTSSYSFDYFDPAYRITTEDDVLIAMVGDKAALMDKEGKLISDKYSEIYIINEKYYEVINIGEDGKTSYGVIGSDGSEIIAPADHITAIYITPNEDGFLVYTQNSAYFTDLAGKTVSDVFADVQGAYDRNEGRRRYTNATGVSSFTSVGSYNTDFSLDSDNYIIRTESGYMLYGLDLKPVYDKVYTDITRLEDYDYWDNSSYTNDNYPQHLNGFKCKYTDADSSVSYDFITTDGEAVLTDCDSISTSSWYNLAKYPVEVKKAGSTYLYDRELNQVAVLPFDSYTLVKTLSGTGTGYGYTTASKYSFDSDMYIINANGKYYLYNSDFSESKEIAIGNDTDQVISSVQTKSSFNGADFAVTVDYADHSEDEYFVVNNDMDICRIDPYNEYRLYDYIIAVDDANIDRYVKDFSGNTVLELPYYNSNISSSIFTDSNGNTDRYYVVTDPEYNGGKGRFTVYDSSMNALYTDIDGWFSGSSHEADYEGDMNSNYCVLTDEITDDGQPVKKYGWFDLEKGVVIEAVYDKLSIVKKYDISTNEVIDNNTPVRTVFIAESDGKVYLLDSEGKELKNLDSSYQFVGGTASAYSTIITFNSTGDTLADSSSIGYDVFAQKVVYSQTGKYDYVDTFYDGYAIARVYGENGNQDLWSDSGVKGTLIDLSGNELVPLSENNRRINTYNGAYGKMISISGAGTFVFEALDGEFAAKYGFDVAARAYQFTSVSDGSYSFEYVYSSDYPTGIYYTVKDGKCGIYDINGNSLFDREFDDAQAFYDGIAKVSYHDDDKNNYSVLIDKNGEYVFEPARDLSITYSDGTFYTKYYGDLSDAVLCRDYKGTDRFNEFTEKYGYKYAVESNGLYVVSDGTNYGVVTSGNEIVIPLEYKDVLCFRANGFSFSHVRDELRDELSGENYTDLIKKLDDGTLLINLKTWDNTVKAFTITGGLELGDVNGDDSIDSSDAALILQQYALVQASKDGKFTQEQIDAADFNHDGNIDSSDAALILKTYAENQSKK